MLAGSMVTCTEEARGFSASNWSSPLHFVNRPHRYSELVTELEVVSEGMLSQRLKELERARVVERRVIGEQPVRVEYHLTDKGRGLGRVIGGLERWAEQWM